MARAQFVTVKDLYYMLLWLGFGFIFCVFSVVVTFCLWFRL